MNVHNSGAVAEILALGVGAWQFGGGLIEPTDGTAFGNTDSRNTDASAVTVASGATLHLTHGLILFVR